MQAKKSKKINEITVKELSQCYWGILDTIQFPGLQEVRILSTSKKGKAPVQTKDVQFRGYSDFDIYAFGAELKKQCIQAYYDLVKDQGEQAADILQYMKVKTQ